MISKQKCLFYFVGDKPFKDLKEAQKADLIQLMPEQLQENHEALANWLIENAQAIVDNLTTTPTSRLKARKSHGGTKKRTKLQAANLAT